MPSPDAMKTNIQTIVVLLIAALLGWIGYTVNSTQVAMAGTQKDIANMSKTVDGVKLRVETLAPLNAFIERDRRITQLEIALKEIEKDVYACKGHLDAGK